MTACAIGATLVAAFAAPTASAADWQDFAVGARYGSNFSEPGIDADIKKVIGNLSYANGWKYGGNFFNVDILQSDHNDPAAGPGSQSGATEFYAIYRGQLSLAKTTGTKLGLPFVRDASLYFGGDLSTKNTAFAPRVRKWLVGPALNFDVPGFWDLAVVARGEHNHNGIVGKNVRFDTTWGVSTAWLIKVPAARGRFTGYFDVIGPKGKDGFGDETKTELHGNAYFLVDVGSFFDKKDTVFAGVGYEYWKNKFGANPPTPGTQQSTPMIAVEFHL